MGLKVHSGHFVYSEDPIIVISSYSEEMAQPSIPLNVSFFSAYHLGEALLSLLVLQTV